jgi:hypothetical protein
MLERDLKMAAMSLATQLPDDEATARKVYALLGELMDIWIFVDGQGQSFELPSKPSGNILSLDASPIGNPEVLPR